MSDETPDIRIPADLVPRDGRFGSGPSRVRTEAVEALARAADGYLGTSHRQASVRFQVAALRNGLSELLALPDGYEILLGNGGTTLFWDAAAFGLIERRSQHLSFGEFSAKFAAAVQAAPHLAGPEVIESPAGTHPDPLGRDDIDLYALTQNETSTGVMMPVTRPSGASADALVAVDATSGVGGLRFDPAEADVYYFAPQKGLAADGGLWLAACSPRCLARIERIAASHRWIPASLDLKIALDNSRKDQTYNTPALATIFLAVQQVEWINSNGGLDWSAARCDRSAEILYGWADKADFAAPFVAEPADRSHVVATIDFDGSLDALTLAAVLRANAIVDTEPYRKLGRNQLRIAMFPAIDPADIEALTHCIDYVIDRLA
ncbi:MAG: Phosphoserine aminotransferase [Acidimicrobiales bacterium]|nr:Phosphoserine aminotransferase [Acidimicrobiales bacterium]